MAVRADQGSNYKLHRLAGYGVPSLGGPYWDVSIWDDRVSHVARYVKIMGKTERPVGESLPAFFFCLIA